MQYTYAPHYGEASSKQRQEAIDSHVDKGLTQALKEDQLPFPTLLAKLRRESETYAQAQRRTWPAPHEALFGILAGYKVVEGYVCTVSKGYREEVVKERLYPLAEFWTRVANGTHHLYRTEDERP